MKGKPPAALSIAGFDPSNGAGVTADLQVFAAHSLFGISAITALTVQSTQGVKSVHPVPAGVLQDTLQHLTEDIPPDGIKIGMLGRRNAIDEAANFLEKFGRSTQPANIPVVLDPVLRSSSGAALLEPDGLSNLKERLLPYVSWITPNWAELGLLIDHRLGCLGEVRDAATYFGQQHPHLQIVVTGGDMEGEPIDLWRSPQGEFRELQGTRIKTTSTHGTGCAFSSSLLSQLVLGTNVDQAVLDAKAYVEGALRHAPEIGQGRGPLNLLWPLAKPPQL